MAKRWACYLAALLGCLAFFAAYQGWLAWVILLAVFWLPLLSLLVSLPAMLSCRFGSNCGRILSQGEQWQIEITNKSRWPLPPCRFLLEAEKTLTGEVWQLSPGDRFPTDHVGYYRCRFEKCRVYDYLGLFGIRCIRGEQTGVLVRPTPVPMEISRSLQNRVSCAWRPKPGGGFGENHELRLYRPGDGMNQVHWKLTAKVGKLMVRQSMEPAMGETALSLDLAGDDAQLDRKFGRLLFLGQYLLNREISFSLWALTGEGVFTAQVLDRESLLQQIDKLLAMPAAREGSLADKDFGRGWHCHIGGEPDET